MNNRESPTSHSPCVRAGGTENGTLDELLAGVSPEAAAVGLVMAEVCRQDEAFSHVLTNALRARLYRALRRHTDGEADPTPRWLAFGDGYTAAAKNDRAEARREAVKDALRKAHKQD